MLPEQKIVFRSMEKLHGSYVSGNGWLSYPMVVVAIVAGLIVMEEWCPCVNTYTEKKNGEKAWLTMPIKEYRI